MGITTIKLLNIAQLILTSSSSASLRFFVYPDPRGSKEPSPALLCFGSSLTPAPGGAKNRSKLSWRARRSQNQFTPLGAGVNKLIFNKVTARNYSAIVALIPIIDSIVAAYRFPNILEPAAVKCSLSRPVVQPFEGIT